MRWNLITVIYEELGEGDRDGSRHLKAYRFVKGQIEIGDEPKYGVATAVGSDKWCLGFYSSSFSYRERNEKGCRGELS